VCVNQEAGGASGSVQPRVYPAAHSPWTQWVPPHPTAGAPLPLPPLTPPSVPTPSLPLPSYPPSLQKHGLRFPLSALGIPTGAPSARAQPPEAHFPIGAGSPQAHLAALGVFPSAGICHCLCPVRFPGAGAGPALAPVLPRHTLGAPWRRAEGGDCGWVLQNVWGQQLHGREEGYRGERRGREATGVSGSQWQGGQRLVKRFSSQLKRFMEPHMKPTRGDKGYTWGTHELHIEPVEGKEGQHQNLPNPSRTAHPSAASVVSL